MDDKQEIPHVNDFKLQGVLGSGGFGEVVLMQKLTHGADYMKTFAVKKLPIHKTSLAKFQNEESIGILARECPFLAGLQYSFKDNDTFYLAFELAKCDLHDILKKGRLNQIEVKFIMAQAVIALEFLHKHGLVHRDIKLENFLLRYDGFLELTDYGLCTKEDQLATIRGTLCYLSPDLLKRNKGSSKLDDMWALGVMIFELLTGKTMFEASDDNELVELIKLAEIRKPVPLINTDLEVLFDGLCQIEPELRFDAPTGKLCATFNNMDWSSLLMKKIKSPFLPPQQKLQEEVRFGWAPTQDIEKIEQKHQLAMKEILDAKNILQEKFMIANDEMAKFKEQIEILSTRNMQLEKEIAKVNKAPEEAEDNNFDEAMQAEDNNFDEAMQNDIIFEPNNIAEQQQQIHQQQPQGIIVNGIGVREYNPVALAPRLLNIACKFGCGRRFRDLKILKQHYRDHDARSLGKFECPVCSHPYTRKQKLQAHLGGNNACAVALRATLT